jgi:hypothetical protein
MNSFLKVGLQSLKSININHVILVFFTSLILYNFNFSPNILSIFLISFVFPTFILLILKIKGNDINIKMKSFISIDNIVTYVAYCFTNVFLMVITIIPFALASKIPILKNFEYSHHFLMSLGFISYLSILTACICEELKGNYHADDYKIFFVNLFKSFRVNYKAFIPIILIFSAINVAVTNLNSSESTFYTTLIFYAFYLIVFEVFVTIVSNKKTLLIN